MVQQGETYTSTVTIDTDTLTLDEVTVELTDPTGNTISTGEVVDEGDGVYTSEKVFPSDADTGVYTFTWTITYTEATVTTTDTVPVTTTETPKYGDVQAVEQRVSIETTTGEGETVSEILIITTLVAADSWIDSELQKAQLNLPSAPYPGELVQAANFRSLWDLLTSLFNADEEENKKANSYLSQAEAFLMAYIQTQSDTLSLSGESGGINPYSNSKSHRSIRAPMDRIIR